MKRTLLLLAALLLAPMARAGCTVGFTFDPGGFASGAPVTVAYTSYVPSTPSTPTIAMRGNTVVVTERIATITEPPPPAGGPCRTRTATLPPLPQASYWLLWEVREENGRLWSQEQAHFNVGSPVVTGVSRPPGALARIGTVLAVTAAAPGFLHVHYEAQTPSVMDPVRPDFYGPGYRAQFVGSQLIVEQEARSPGPESPSWSPPAQRVEDFDMPLPPPGDYTLVWFGPRVAFRVDAELPATRCGLADYKPRFTYGGDHMTMDDFYTGAEPTFDKPMVALVDGSVITVVQPLTDPVAQFPSATLTTRCHSATVDLPPLAPGRYQVYWRYVGNSANWFQEQHLTMGTLEVRARRRGAGK